LVRFNDGCRNGIGDPMVSDRPFVRAQSTAFLALLLMSSPSRAQPAEPAPAKAFKQTIYAGASRYVYYQVPPDAAPRIQALYRALGQAENDQYLSEQLQQLLLEYTEQERLLGSVRTSRELLYGPSSAGGGSAGYTSPDGVTKAWTVQGLVAAAEARSRFAGQINRELEVLQTEAAGKGKGGGMAAREALRTEYVALQKLRKARQACQVASQREQEASRLVKEAQQLERQAADGKQPSTLIQRFLHQTGLLAVTRHLLGDGHRRAQQAAQEATQALEEATVELHAAQVESMSTMKPAPVVSRGAAAPAPKPLRAPPRSVGPGDELVQAIQAMTVQQKEAIASLTERSAALVARREAQQERMAILLEEAAAQRAHGNSAIAHQPAAEQSVPSGSWMVVGVCALGTLQLIGFALVIGARKGFSRRLGAKGSLAPMTKDE
jgi:hypothetical protein